MATPPSATPTPITPPRVPLIDERTGLIDRAWYLFFLSLFRASETIDTTTLGVNTESLMASYDAALRALAQTTETQPPPSDCCADVLAIRQEVQSAPPTGVAELTQEVSSLRQEVQSAPPTGVVELAQEVSDLRQEVQTIPRPQLGTFAALQQANLPWTTFDTTAQSVPTDIGTVAWDGGTTLGIQMTSNVIQRVGETEYVYVKASATITKGQLCYHTGSVGSSGVITAAPTPIGLTDPNQIVGVAAESIALNDFGLIQISGDLRGFDTTGSSVGETWADGDPLYYNPAYVGSMTKVKPSAPNQKSYIGEVINAGSGGSGSIHVRIVQGSVLGGTDSNVQFGTLANNDLIQYNTTLGYWSNVTASSVAVGTATNLAGGVAGSLPYQSGVNTTTFLPIGTATQVLKVNAGATAPQWVSGAALTKTDDTNVTLTLGGTPSTSLLAATSLTLGWTGQLAVSRGGTGLSSFSANQVFYASSTSTIGQSANLTFNGTNLGVGESSPGARLHVGGQTASAKQAILATAPSNSNFRLEALNGDTGTSSGTLQAKFGLRYDDGSTITDTAAFRFFRGAGAGDGSIGFVTANAVQATLNASGIGLGTTSFGTSAAKVLSVGSGTEPTSGPADTVQFYSVDRSAGNTIPAFYCEGSGVTNAGITSTAVTHKIAMKINGTIYYLLATTNAT